MSITKYEKGSVAELWNVSFPLMLSSLSVMLMIFVDRLLLANFSTAALTAAVNATTLSWAFIVAPMVLAGISEVFVAQYNGAKKFTKIGEPVWQMIWFSMATFLIFLPLSIWGGGLFYGYSGGKAMEREYFKWLMLFGPSFSIYAALNGFFVGRGKTRLVTLIAFIFNGVNTLLDLILIFGVKGLIPPLGIKGAAIATSTSGLLQAICLLLVFLNAKNRNTYHTHIYNFNAKICKGCLKIGAPWSAAIFIEIISWAFFYIIMTNAGPRYITIAGVCQSIIILFYFFADGMGKGATAIAGNFIGAGEKHLVNRTLRSGVILHLLFYICILVFYFLFSDFFIHIFLPNIGATELEQIKPSIFTCLLIEFTTMMFDGFKILISGLLTAAGDTNFILFTGSISIWVFMLLPVYLAVIKGGASVEIALLISMFYFLILALIYLRRFLRGKWKLINLQEN